MREGGREEGRKSYGGKEGRRGEEELGREGGKEGRRGEEELGREGRTREGRREGGGRKN